MFGPFLVTLFLQMCSLPPSCDSEAICGVVNSRSPENVALPSDDVTLPSDHVSGDAGVELPEPVVSDNEDHDADIELPNAWDEDQDDTEQDIELLEHTDTHDWLVVPQPAAAKHLGGRQDIAEYYSPPRVLRAGRKQGLTGVLSLDILTGWDFQHEALRVLSLQLLGLLHIAFLVLSPPCTMFSSLQWLWNVKKMSQSVFSQRWSEAMLLLEHAMACAAAQHAAKRRFVFEHPAGAKSWSQACVQHVLSLQGVELVVIDMCMLGLQSKVKQLPLRKRTKIMTNCPVLASALRGYKCDGTHTHGVIQGSEGGMRCSTWAQFYPPRFVDVLVRAAKEGRPGDP